MTTIVAIAFLSNLAAFGAEPTAQNPESAAPQVSPAKVEKADKAEKTDKSEKAEKSGEKAEGEPKRYGKAHPLLDPISVGPKLVLGIMIPGVGLEAKAWDWLGFAFDFSYIPQISISQYAFGGTSWDANVKFYPLRGAFFLGVNTGTQQIRASRSQAISGVDVTLTGTNSIFFLSPTLGWEWVAKSGFFFGLELGAQIGMSVTTSISDNIDNPIIEATPQYLQLQSDISSYTSTVNTALRTYPLPIFALHIGYLF